VHRLAHGLCTFEHGRLPLIDLRQRLLVATAGGGGRVAAGLHILLIEAPVSRAKTAMNQPAQPSEKTTSGSHFWTAATLSTALQIRGSSQGECA
jgi:hypothetical protein